MFGGAYFHSRIILRYLIGLQTSVKCGGRQDVLQTSSRTKTESSSLFKIDVARGGICNFISAEMKMHFSLLRDSPQNEWRKIGLDDEANLLSPSVVLDLL